MVNNSGSQFEAQIIGLMKEFGVEDDALKETLYSKAQNVGIDQLREGFSALQAAGRLGSVTPDLSDFTSFLRPGSLGDASLGVGQHCHCMDAGGAIREAESDRPVGCTNGNLGTMVEAGCDNGLGMRAEVK